MDTLKRISLVLTVFSSFCLGILMILNVVDIVGTKFLYRSIPGALDISEELMVFLTILPISYIAITKDHIRITLVETRMPTSVRQILKFLRYSVGAFISGFLSYRTFDYFLLALRLKQLKKGIDLPIWPASLVVCVGFGLLCFAWLIMLFDSSGREKIKDGF